MNELATLLERVGTPRLVVVGDVILDRYAWGSAKRVSPEAPVIVLRADDDEIRLGGAASVAYLLRGLGALVTLAAAVSPCLVELLRILYDGVMSTVADQFAATVSAAGVKRIYGIVGDGLTDAIRRQGKITWVHLRHEEVAAFAAGADAHLSGSLAVCAGSCGPGNLHLINGLFDCHRSRVPVLAIAAHIPSAEIGAGYCQETHPEGLFKECSHYCELVSNAQQMPRILEIAIREAVGKRGVSVVVIPGDVALHDAIEAPSPAALDLLPAEPIVVPRPASLNALADFLNGASRVTLLCGAGCAGAHDQLVALGEKLKSPIVHALKGKEHVEWDNPYDVGMTGLIGFSSGYYAMNEP